MIKFNNPFIGKNELAYMEQALRFAKLSGDGSFTKDCQDWLEKNLSVKKAFLTHSCTAALEMAAILIDVNPGDEIIMPSFTFVSTANAFVLRGGVPIFVDIRPDTLNIDEKKIESAITSRTKAIVPVHYAGVPCEMNSIMEIARKHNLFVIEDAAQGIMSKHNGASLGSIGDIGCLSFHDTKNIISGEGGALLINNEAFIERAEIIREKGTNRTQFFRGQVDKYTWADIGSSYLPNEMTAAFLLAQLEAAEDITCKRMDVWNKYYQTLSGEKLRTIIQPPTIPSNCKHNAHIFYLLANSLDERMLIMKSLKSRGIESAFHYVPLHTSPYGIKNSRFHGDLSITNEVSDRLFRLPMSSNLGSQVNIVINELITILEKEF
jgi:dTDP-4-amino-4,6-dideoxygalactose transaminase